MASPPAKRVGTGKNKEKKKLLILATFHFCFNKFMVTASKGGEQSKWDAAKYKLNFGFPECSSFFPDLDEVPSLMQKKHFRGQVFGVFRYKRKGAKTLVTRGDCKFSKVAMTSCTPTPQRCLSQSKSVRICGSYLNHMKKWSQKADRVCYTDLALSLTGFQFYQDAI